MGRVSLMEKLKHRNIDIDIEIRKMLVIYREPLTKDAAHLFYYIDNKLGCFNHYEFLDLLSNNIDKSTKINTYLDLCEIFLIFLEGDKKHQMYSHLIGFRSSITDYESVLEGIIFVLDKLNYEITYNVNKLPIIVLKDAVAEKVASIPEYREIKWRILDYNLHKATLDNKKAIIVEIYKVFEKVRTSLKKTNKNIESAIGELSQLIRHTEDEGKSHIYQFYYKEEEKWCDRIYDFLLEALLHEHNKKIISEMKAIKK